MSLLEGLPMFSELCEKMMGNRTVKINRMSSKASAFDGILVCPIVISLVGLQYEPIEPVFNDLNIVRCLTKHYISSSSTDSNE